MRASGVGTALDIGMKRPPNEAHAVWRRRPSLRAPPSTGAMHRETEGRRSMHPPWYPARADAVLPAFPPMLDLDRSPRTLSHMAGSPIAPALALVGLAACSDAALMPAGTDVAPPVGADVRVEGEFCTDAPEDVVFPIKVLFVVDTSGSLRFTDPGQQRALAVDQVITRHLGNPAARFGIVGFSGRVRDLSHGFSNSRSVLSGAVALLREADSVTDYQGALGMAFTVLVDDIIRSEVAERARTTYVVVFFSDGTPQPQCSRDGDEGDKFLVCEYPKDQVGVPADVFPEMEAGADYNQPYQIVDKVDSIMKLRDEFRVGEIRLHTGFLYDEEVARDVANAFSLDPEEGEALLRSMAKHGRGVFLRFSSGQEISFLPIDLTSIKRPFVVRSLIVSNETALPSATVPVADADEDGLSDGAEFELGSDPLARDTDGDGYQDLFEVRHKGQGHDPLDPLRPAVPCEAVVDRGRSDRDRDGLSACEEVLLGSDPRLYDSDADGLPDRLEFLHGLDPADASDVRGDLDLDGTSNRAEVLAHTDPTRRDAYVGGGFDHYRYRVDLLEQKYDGRQCSWFETRHVRLVTPEPAGGDRLGENRIAVYLGQVPEDRPADFGLFRVACHRARYVPPDFVEPKSGVIRISRDDFVPSSTFDSQQHCRRPDEGQGADDRSAP